MKIRLGFVSNSSSSSFVVIGSKLKDEEVYSKADKLIKEGRLYVETTWWGCEGTDFFEMTEEIWNIYKEGNSKGYFYFYDAKIVSEEPVKIKKRDIEGDEFEVFTFDVDNRCTSTTDEFKHRYTDED